jgi:hypothetical protein
MKPIFSINLVRELRGSPLTVLIAMLLLEQSGQVPVTAQALKDATGYRDHTITDALSMLESPTRQIVQRVYKGWRLSTGFQLPLELVEENREYREKVLSSSCSLQDIKLTDSVEQEEEIQENRDFRENLAAAQKAGIAEPKASQLAALEHVTPKLIRGHVTYALETGKAIGTAIYRIEHKWPVPEKYLAMISKIDAVAKQTGHDPGCKCTDCTFARFGAPLCPDCGHYYCECEDAGE